ncbi:MAG: response regulator [Lachnospiraceae bacterium]|nr:response regulator [Lachnospiraceae bacterium]
MKNFRNSNEELNSALDSFLDNSQDYVFIKDLNSVYVAASDSFARLFGYSGGDEIVGLDAIELTRNENIGNVLREGDYKVITTGEPIIDSLEEGKITGRSMKCTLSTSKYPIINKNRSIIGILGIARDVTSERKSKKLLDDYKKSYDLSIKENESKTALLTGMSYDIRNPINSIMGLVALARAHIKDTEKLNYDLEKIKEAGKYVLSIVNEVLDIEKIEEGKAELNVCDFNFIDFLDNFEAMTRDSAKAKKVKFTLEKNGLVNTNVVGDPTRIEQIFTNLVSNSLKFTPQNGEVTVTVNEREDGNGVARYEITFADNGVGIDEEIKKHIFEPFAVKREKKLTLDNGVGLGMVITKNIINMMGGEIFVDSEVGKGTVVTVRLNLLIADENMDDSEENSDEDSTVKEDFTGKRALLVEDNDLNAEIAEEILKMTGMEVERACDGQEAVCVFEGSEKDYFDAIFMDIQMPIMDGYEATKIIRRMKRKDAKSVPIIALTANAFVSDINDAKEAGMNEHLSKPIEFEKLCMILSKYL